MFKVICLDDSDNERGCEPPPELPDWWVECGHTYTVIEECMGRNGDGELIPSFGLAEDPNNHEVVWEQRRFAKLSDISETEMSREYNFKNATV